MDGQYGIEETKDLIAFAEKIIDSLAAHKIDGSEIASTLVTTAPAAISAMVGAGDISKELKDLSDEERSALIAQALPVLQKLVGMFVKLDAA